MKQKNEFGFGLAEVLLASGVLIMVIASVVALSRLIIRGYALTASRTAATYLAQEALEAVRNMRDTYWLDANPGTAFNDLPSSGGPVSPVWHPEWRPLGIQGFTTTPTWHLAAGPEQIIIGTTTFTRSVAAQAVTINGALDPYMRLVTVTVSWDEQGRGWTVTTQTYLSDWRLES